MLLPVCAWSPPYCRQMGGDSVGRREGEVAGACEMELLWVAKAANVLVIVPVVVLVERGETVRAAGADATAEAAADAVVVGRVEVVVVVVGRGVREATDVAVVEENGVGKGAALKGVHRHARRRARRENAIGALINTRSPCIYILYSIADAERPNVKFRSAKSQGLQGAR